MVAVVVLMPSHPQAVRRSRSTSLRRKSWLPSVGVRIYTLYLYASITLCGVDILCVSCCCEPCAVVRMWRERKRRSEAKALTMMNGNKLRKDNGIQSAHVVGILSRRMIREVPALQFFDVEPETIRGGNGAVLAAKALLTNGAEHLPSVRAAAAVVNRSTPRGVCYTLDANGCRCIKMESGALQNSRMGQRERHKKKEEVTIEKAMGKTLRRKYVLIERICNPKDLMHSYL